MPVVFDTTRNIFDELAKCTDRDDRAGSTQLTFHPVMLTEADPLTLFH
jgi:hypothetical protein